ncbi:CPBP family intramembrane glutamic endopeptidase [Herbiconiux ginsengi]|uniref:CAAX protease self-immunity n=1 Tax=Herbiconiux ginsengi TaxID=381665 RepID=A0A1H3K674_9MICO|nr:CPBP family intramembrane glutamic endopeptidase [Herbiconiux ginsengi]SDY47671.1 CAAX protease self-immunity [Herbiconiux ginsengi]
MAPEAAQFFFAYLLVVVAIIPVMWVRLRPGMSLARRQVTIMAGIALRIAGFLASFLVILRLAGHQIEPMLAKAGDWPFVAWGRQTLATGGLPLAALIAAGLVLAAAKAVLLWRRTVRRSETLGFVVWHYTRSATTPITEYFRPPETAITAHLPRSVAELFTRGVLGSIVVGITEELMFRVGIPALLLQTGANLWVSVIFSLAMFALLHGYQGWGGVASSGLSGVAYTYIYFVTGDIVLPIVLHALNNAYVLAVLPAVSWRSSRREFDQRMRAAAERPAVSTPAIPPPPGS